MINFVQKMNKDAKKSTSEIERLFWSKVDRKRDWECWEWKAENNCPTYGSFFLEDISISAHRFAYESFHRKKIPEELFVCHRCDNPPCCNPIHLFLGTAKDNVTDMIEKGRQNHKPRLDFNQVVAIREAMYKLSVKEIAKLFGVSTSTISKIWNNDSFKCKEGYYVEFFLTYNKNPFTGDKLYRDWRP